MAPEYQEGGKEQEEEVRHAHDDGRCVLVFGVNGILYICVVGSS